VTGGIGAADRISFAIRSDRPRRVSVQLRTDVPGVQGERWQHSVYADPELQRHSLRIDDFVPAGPTSVPRPEPRHVIYVLFVVERVSTDGRIWVSDVALQR
jgi:hypothetical protein